MVSFQCDACQDVVKKPKLDQHRQRCGASFTCIDCSTTFSGPQQYKAHTSCISEAQKYEKALYKGPKQNSSGGFQNGRQNGGGFSKGYQRGPISSGPNGQPLGDKLKMTYTPPSEEETPVQASTSAPVQAPLIPDPDAIIAAAANIAPESEVVVDKKVKIKKIKKKKEPPPPGETKAERKKRKKIERAARKAEKLKMKAQMRAAKAEATAAKKKEKEARTLEWEIKSRADGPVKDNATPEDGQVDIPAPPSDPQEEVTKDKKKKRKHLEDVSGDANVPLADANEGEQTEQAEEKKDKKKKRTKEGKSDAADATVMEVDSTLDLTNGHVEEPANGKKKSKKRKRDTEDVGGKNVVEEMTDLSFKERARAEKKARKAAKKALLAEQATESS